MKIVLITILLLLYPVFASAQIVQPEAVRLENVGVDGEMKIVKVGNAQAHYMLFCNIKQDGCLTPDRAGATFWLIRTRVGKCPAQRTF